jgi:hypothetical protein
MKRIWHLGRERMPNSLALTITPGAGGRGLLGIEKTAMAAFDAFEILGIGVCRAEAN